LKRQSVAKQVRPSISGVVQNKGKWQNKKERKGIKRKMYDSRPELGYRISKCLGDLIEEFEHSRHPCGRRRGHSGTATIFMIE